jgi:integrase
MATIVLRKQGNGVRYQVKVRLKGFPCKTETFTRRSDATRWASATETHLREARHFPESVTGQHTLSELVARYQREILPQIPKNAKNLRPQLDWWCSQLGDLNLAAVTPAKIAECRDRLLALPTARGKLRSPATAVRYLAVLSHAFSVALREWDWVNDNPLRKVTKPKEPRGRVRFLDDDERVRLLQACRMSANPVLYPIVVLAIATGMRRGELLPLRWDQVDFTRNTITLHETKNGERRAVPLVGHALEMLRGCYDVRRIDTDLIFPSTTVAKPLDITKAWRTAIAKSGLQEFRFHDLRHTAASYLAQGGATPIDIAAVLGHKTLAMVKRYAHLSESRVRDVLFDMNQRAFGPLATERLAPPA